VGESVGYKVGNIVGLSDGLFEGDLDGDFDGEFVGLFVGDSEGLDVGDVVGGIGGGIGGQIVPMQTAEQVPPCWGVPLAQAAAATTKSRPGGTVPSAVAVASVTIVVTPVLALKKTITVALATNLKDWS